MKTHGMRNTREYNMWAQAKGRCYNRRNKDYGKYGARGIHMCGEWRASFEAFYRDMGPADGKSLGRINNNGPYSFDNCRWETLSQQQRNKRNGWRVFVGAAEFDSLTSAAKHFAVSITTINRWCRGFTDARRGTFTPKRDDCRQESRR